MVRWRTAYDRGSGRKPGQLTQGSGTTPTILPGGVVALWDAKTGKAVHRFDGLSTGASSVAFSADGKSVAAGTNGAGGELPAAGEVRVWDVEKGKELRAIKLSPKVEPGEFISAGDVALSADGKRVVAGVGSGSRGRPGGLIIEDAPAAVRVWEVGSGKEVLSASGHKAGVGRVAFSPDGKLLASAGADRTVRVWDAITGKEVRALPFDTARIDALVFSPDGRRLAAGGGDDKKPAGVKVWSLARE